MLAGAEEVESKLLGAAGLIDRVVQQGHGDAELHRGNLVLRGRVAELA